METKCSDAQMSKATAADSVPTTMEHNASQIVNHPVSDANNNELERRIEAVEKRFSEEIRRLEARIEELEVQATQNKAELEQLRADPEASVQRKEATAVEYDAATVPATEISNGSQTVEEQACNVVEEVAPADLVIGETRSDSDGQERGEDLQNKHITGVCTDRRETISTMLADDYGASSSEHSFDSTRSSIRARGTIVCFRSQTND